LVGGDRFFHPTYVDYLPKASIMFSFALFLHVFFPASSVQYFSFTIPLRVRNNSLVFFLSNVFEKIKPIFPFCFPKAISRLVPFPIGLISQRSLLGSSQQTPHSSRVRQLAQVEPWPSPGNYCHVLVHFDQGEDRTLVNSKWARIV